MEKWGKTCGDLAAGEKKGHRKIKNEEEKAGLRPGPY
jgi:hypothetical protein